MSRGGSRNTATTHCSRLLAGARPEATCCLATGPEVPVDRAPEKKYRYRTGMVWQETGERRWRCPSHARKRARERASAGKQHGGSNRACWERAEAGTGPGTQ